MRVYLNFTEVRGPYGGANSFLRALTRALTESGVQIVRDVKARYDVALLNALTNGIDADFARRIAERGVPIVHRKVGYRASGSPEMRATDPDGTIRGDRLQLDLSPYIRHSIFQSTYSRDLFIAGGFTGDHTTIHNGVEDSVFGQRSRFLHRSRRLWVRGEPMRVAISTWSTDPNKGFADYERIDDEIAGRRDVVITLAGRVPEGTRFRSIRTAGPYSRARLARFLRAQHVLLHLARWETCSNALLEGINCGLPVIYADSGSNREVADAYGVAYDGDFAAALEQIEGRYDELQARTRTNPYTISKVVPKYLAVLESVL